MSTAIVSSELILAVIVASVMGSLHCVGMCGPFALMATGSANVKSGAARRLTMYHLGRLTTYVVAGVFAGVAGAALSAGGHWLGIQSAAARVAGGVMIALGVMRLVSWWRSQAIAEENVNIPATQVPAIAPARGLGVRISGVIAKTRPTVNRLPPSGRAFAAGTLTTLLPCGWLYLFLLVAAGTGTALSAVLVMIAFWLGTLPALTALVLGAFKVAPRFRSALPIVGALLLLITGLYTATGRAAADMSSLADKAGDVSDVPGDADASRTLEMLADEPLPCCSPPATSE